MHYNSVLKKISFAPREKNLIALGTKYTIVSLQFLYFRNFMAGSIKVHHFIDCSHEYMNKYKTIKFVYLFSCIKNFHIFMKTNN